MALVVDGRLRMIQTSCSQCLDDVVVSVLVRYRQMVLDWDAQGLDGGGSAQPLRHQSH